MTTETGDILHALTTSADKTKAEFEALRRTLRSMLAIATEVAQLRKVLYDEYVKVGFTPAQALILCEKIAF